MRELDPKCKPEYDINPSINDLLIHIEEPFISFADKTHSDGRPFSVEEQLRDTRWYIKDFIGLLRLKNYPENAVEDAVRRIIYPPDRTK